VPIDGSVPMTGPLTTPWVDAGTILTGTIQNPSGELADPVTYGSAIDMANYPIFGVGRPFREDVVVPKGYADMIVSASTVDLTQSPPDRDGLLFFLIGTGLAKPIVAVEVSPTDPFTITATAVNTSTAAFHWGDGSPDSPEIIGDETNPPSADHTFAFSGFFDVWAYNDAGVSDPIGVLIEDAPNVAPPAAMVIDVIDMPNRLVDARVYGTTACSIEWGDGSPDTTGLTGDPNFGQPCYAQHTYPATGTYTAKGYNAAGETSMTFTLTPTGE
jgi:hypothetical protein